MKTKTYTTDELYHLRQTYRGPDPTALDALILEYRALEHHAEQDYERELRVMGERIKRFVERGGE